jgi:hypothetical protein
LSNTIQPIFIFSLPRSGSTLAQRILAGHRDIATVAEPWLLLPYLYTLKEEGSYAEYGHRVMRAALKDFYKSLPNGKDDYIAAISDLALQLYTKAAEGDEKYFLDKTPRYHLVADDIIQMFPEGKFIFLWRNPLAIIASIMDTWAQGRWNLYELKVDLFMGLANLIASYEKYGNKAHAVRYEDLLVSPDENTHAIYTYLGFPAIDAKPDNLSKVQLKGRMGDPTGVQNYQSISKEPLDKWKRTLSNPVRKAWCRHYLKWIGRDRLAVMGYDYDLLLAELHAVPVTMRHTGSDIMRMTYGAAYYVMDLRILKSKLKAFPKWHKVCANT